MCATCMIAFRARRTACRWREGGCPGSALHGQLPCCGYCPAAPRLTCRCRVCTVDRRASADDHSAVSLRSAPQRSASWAMSPRNLFCNQLILKRSRLGSPAGSSAISASLNAGRHSSCAPARTCRSKSVDDRRFHGSIIVYGEVDTSTVSGRPGRVTTTVMMGWSSVQRPWKCSATRDGTPARPLVRNVQAHRPLDAVATEETNSRANANLDAFMRLPQRCPTAADQGSAPQDAGRPPEGGLSIPHLAFFT